MELVRMGSQGSNLLVPGERKSRERTLSVGAHPHSAPKLKKSPSPSRSPLLGHSRSSSSTQTATSEWQVTPSSRTIRYGHFPIRDTTTPDKAMLQAVITALFFSQAQGRRAVLHCNGGYGRTGTVMGAWLVTGGYVTDTIETVPNMYWPVKTKTGQQGYVPYQQKKSAGENALELLAKKWKGVEKSWYAPTTPGNEAQMAFVRAIRPPPTAVKR